MHVASTSTSQLPAISAISLDSAALSNFNYLQAYFVKSCMHHTERSSNLMISLSAVIAYAAPPLARLLS
jgi:hypothetical protein